MTATGRKPDPIAGPTPPPGLARTTWKALHRLRALLGLRRAFRENGVYYKETGTELLWRALSRKGSGSKEYRVTFPPPDRSKLLIHCTADRIYADAMGPLMLPHYQRAVAMIRPGMRVLDMPCNTGYAAAWLAEQVGPSGAVVAIDPDTESITYAQKRYASGKARNVAFEIGDASSLAGETDGSFDAVLAIGGLARLGEFAGVVKELWRVVAPGGWMLVGVPAAVFPSAPSFPGSAGELIDAITRAAGPLAGGAGAPPVTPELLSTPADDLHLTLVRKHVF
jgi:SAM-dependent methyltransferase